MGKSILMQLSEGILRGMQYVRHCVAPIAPAFPSGVSTSIFEYPWRAKSDNRQRPEVEYRC